MVCIETNCSLANLLNHYGSSIIIFVWTYYVKLNDILFQTVQTEMWKKKTSVYGAYVTYTPVYFLTGVLDFTVKPDTTFYDWAFTPSDI